MFKRMILVGWVLFAGCEKKAAPAGDDCDVVKKDPEHAVAQLSKKYPNDGVKVAQTIENCVAPTGDECDRVAALVKAIPSMMGGVNAPRSADEYAATCRKSPPEMRKCFLASYAVAHDAECKKMMADLAAATIDVKPAAPKCDGGTVIVHINEDGVWVVTGMDPKSRCFGKRAGTDLDTKWLETELAQFKTLDCKPSVDVSAEASVRYQDVISAMDVSVKVGLIEVGLASPEDMPVSFKPSEQEKYAQHCPATVIASADMKGSAAGAPSATGHRTLVPAPGAPPADVKSAPVVIVTKQEISVAGKMTDEVKDAASGSGELKGLALALVKPATPDAPVIIQADQDTPATVINRVVLTIKTAGYDNVLFAVKNK